MKLNDLVIGDVCITAYQDFNNANILKAVSIVSKKYSDGSAKLSDIVGLNQEVLAKGWVADDTTTTIKKVLFNQEIPKDLEEIEGLVKKRLRKDFPQYLL